MLPNSTERAITIAGIPQSIIECVKQICVVMLEVGPLPGPVPRAAGRPAALGGLEMLRGRGKQLLGDKRIAGDYGLIQVRLLELLKTGVEQGLESSSWCHPRPCHAPGGPGRKK